MSKNTEAWLRLHLQVFRARKGMRNRYGESAYRDFWNWWVCSCPFVCIEVLRNQGKLK